MKELDEMLEEVRLASSIEELHTNLRKFINYGKNTYSLDIVMNKMVEKTSNVSHYMETLIAQESEEEVYHVFEEEIFNVLSNSDDLTNDVNTILKNVPVFLNGTSSNVNILRMLPNDTREELYQEVLKEDKTEPNYNIRKESILISLDDDAKKIEYLQTNCIHSDGFDDIYMIVTIIKSLSEDINKIKMMATLQNIDEYDKVDIIKSLSNDRLKVGILAITRGAVTKGNTSKVFETLEISDEQAIDILETVEADSLAVGFLKKYGLYEFDNIKRIAKSTSVVERIIQDKQLSENEKIQLISNIENEEEVQRLLKEKTELEQISETIKKDSSLPTRIGLPQNLTFGVELEAEGLETSNTKRIFETLNRSNKEILKWTIKKDDSLEKGTEIVSPILTDTEENIHQIEYMSKMMTSIGFHTTNTCGGHIHFGADFLNIDGDNKKALQNLLTIWKEGEELFYKMSNGEGKVTREEATTHAGRIADILDDNIDLSSKEEYDRILEKLQESRRQGVNFCNLKPGGKNTIEFRLSNGTIDSKEIEQNIYLFGRLMVVSKDMALNPEKYDSKMQMLKSRDLSEAEKEEALLNLLFDSEKEKVQYRNRWDRVKEEPTYDLFAATETTYRRGDFSIRDAAKAFVNQIKLEDMYVFTTEVQKTILQIRREERIAR